MARSVDAYLRALEAALDGCDAALVRDALSDAEEHLRADLAAARRERPDVPDDELLAPVLERFGDPAEVAAAYRDAEARLYPPSPLVAATPARPGLRGLLGVFVDPRAYASLLYLFVSFATGIGYFVWVVTGLALAVGLMPLIIGLPFLGLFLLSTLTMALLEGRLVEALTGERMPRRRLFDQGDLGWWGRLKHWLGQRRTWTGLVYLLLQLPLGTAYFTLFVTLTAVSLGTLTLPLTQGVFGLPHGHVHGVDLFFPGWAVPLLAVGGAVLLFLELHLARACARLHARWAKAMLV